MKKMRYNDKATRELILKEQVKRNLGRSLRSLGSSSSFLTTLLLPLMPLS